MRPRTLRWTSRVKRVLTPSGTNKWISSLNQSVRVFLGGKPFKNLNKLSYLDMHQIRKIQPNYVCFLKKYLCFFTAWFVLQMSTPDVVFGGLRMPMSDLLMQVSIGEVIYYEVWPYIRHQHQVGAGQHDQHKVQETKMEAGEGPEAGKKRSLSNPSATANVHDRWKIRA